MPRTASIESDPLRNFRFRVNIKPKGNILGLTQLGFMGVSGIAAGSEIIPYREGNDPPTTRKLPGQTDFGPLGLTHGVLPAGPRTAASDWFRQVFALPGGPRNTAGPDFRADSFVVDILEHPRSDVDQTGPNAIVKVRFDIKYAWCASIAFSDLDAGGNGLFIESMQIQHEGFVAEFPS